MGGREIGMMLEPWEMQWAVWAVWALWAAVVGSKCGQWAQIATGAGKLTSSGSGHQIKKQSTRLNTFRLL